MSVNTDPLAQPDLALRELNSQPTVPGRRDEVYCTKVGSTRPDEMYIVSAHMDGHGWGEAANDNASGAALVMEVARVFSAPDVRTERSIRFILWNNEETAYDGSRAYIAQRRHLQGREKPVGSGRYPEPKWLGIIQHDMMLFDHGMPRADGTISPEQRPEADVNVEFQSDSTFARQSQELAWMFQAANEIYATDYPVTVGNHMASTDSTVFMNIVPSISLRGKRARCAGGQRLGSALASGQRRVREFQRPGLPARAQRGTDDARRDRPVGARHTHSRFEALLIERPHNCRLHRRHARAALVAFSRLS
jgi:hypothetical protein